MKPAAQVKFAAVKILLKKRRLSTKGPHKHVTFADDSERQSQEIERQSLEIEWTKQESERQKEESERQSLEIDRQKQESNRQGQVDIPMSIAEERMVLLQELCCRSDRACVVHNSLGWD